MTKPHTWPEFQQRERETRRDWLALILERGKDVAECAAIADIPACSLYRLARQYGLELPSVCPSEKYRRCADAGMTKAEAAQKLGVSTSSVSHAAKRHGLKFKPGKPGCPKGVKAKKGKTTIKKAAPVGAMITGKTMADYAREESARMRQVGRV